ncbi:MAG TPA: hypothetical protein VGR06_32805 [Actinophytocola sp.]|jgi:hypothetical protein|uniref:hypothetical protein n=1 Tax=Actinophytocola sp. TaxID=1872138 RepID=UPI002DF85F07|nr:hypothetical protein [Actinophytocola sp.]
MRRYLHVLLAGAAAAATIIAGATAASADPITPSSWSVSPGGAANGTAGTTLLTIQESGIELTCQSSTVTGAILETGATGSPAQLVTLPAGSVAFQDCSGPFGLVFDVEHVGDWHLNGVTFDPATGVTTGTLTDITANITGFGCSASVAGTVGGTYTNGTGQLAIDPAATLLVTRVDPSDNCFGLINEGEHGSFDGTYTIDPAQTITGTA